MFRAELHAAVEALRHAAPPLTIHTDNQQLVDEWKARQKWCCASHRDGADLGRCSWARCADIGPAINVMEVKAHVAFAKVQSGAMSLQDWVGNGLADT